MGHPNFPIIGREEKQFINGTKIGHFEKWEKIDKMPHNRRNCMTHSRFDS